MDRINSDSRIGGKKTYNLSNFKQTQNRRRYVNFENSSHFICSFNLNNPKLTVFIASKMIDMSSEIKKLLIVLQVIRIEKSMQSS